MAPFMSGAAVSVAGLYTAAFDLQVEWLVVKGIASYADGREKNGANLQVLMPLL